MIGSWRGKGVETGHPMDGLLERFGWHGKRFTGPDGAHPLVFEQTKGGVFSVNPAMIPVGFVIRHADLFRHPLAHLALSSICRRASDRPAEGAAAHDRV